MIKKQIKIKKSKDEAKMFANKFLLENSMLKSIIKTIEWQDDKLVFDSSLGHGYFLFLDNLVEIEIHLSMIGEIAAKQIEKTVDDEFLKLNQ